MYNAEDPELKRQVQYLKIGFTGVLARFILITYGFLTGNKPVLDIGGGLTCCSAAVQSVLIFSQFSTRNFEKASFSDRDNSPGLAFAYKDSLVSLNGESITFFRYSFPFGKSRKIAFADIDHITINEPSLVNGKWRIWGSGDFRTWFPLDIHRSSCDKIFIISMKNGGTKIGFSVENSQNVTTLFEEHNLIVK
ncbi:MAG: hypothetical protein WCC86_06850 [Methanoregula sp.]|uniref:hypothetical protein n=1 Tax=Methanoregula sp. TaxID=2052170 RepID=UPI003BB197EF